MKFQTNHDTFIKIPILSEMGKCVSACMALDNGINCYPLKDYIFQALLLRLTGFQEQKLRCICWNIATFDFEYRRKLLKDEDDLGEYSSFDAKSTIYKTLIKYITALCKKSYSQPFNIGDELNKKEMADKAKQEVINLFSKTNLCYLAEKEYAKFKKDKRCFKPENFANEGLLVGSLNSAYIKLYDKRNRYAHNTLSYQENVPSLSSLVKQDSLEDNIFMWYGILNLLDKLFVQLYEVYVRKLTESNF